VAGGQFSGALPSFATCTLLEFFTIEVNQFSGNLPSFAACTFLEVFTIFYNEFSGALPSFAACTELETFWIDTNHFSGTIPDFAPCTKLHNFFSGHNEFTGYTAGGFATQKDMSTLQLDNNNLTEAAVDAILADLVTSLGIPGRIVCNVWLQGAGNSAPSNPAGLADKATLVAAWGAGNVLTN
jgi:hypothetical protein